jgi:hypothetical protein
MVVQHTTSSRLATLGYKQGLSRCCGLADSHPRLSERLALHHNHGKWLLCTDGGGANRLDKSQLSTRQPERSTIDPLPY